MPSSEPAIASAQPSRATAIGLIPICDSLAIKPCPD